MKSIRAKIMWLLFCSVLVSSLIIGIIGIGLTSNVIKSSSTENMHLLCKNNADKIDVTFARVEESIDTLVHYVESELTDVQSLKDEEFRKNFSAEVQKNALHHIEDTEGAASVYLRYDNELVGKTDGFFYVKLNGADKFESYPLTDISSYADDDIEHVGWWYEPVKSGKATWFEAYFNANINHDIVSYVVPIYKNEQLIGIIGADISTDYIENQVKEVSVLNTGKAAILKSDGTVLYHPNFERGVLIGEGDPGFAGVIEKLTAEDSTKELISYKLKGERRQLASSKLKNGMLMICFAPEAEIYHQQIALTITNTVITVVVVVIALLIAFIVSHRLAQPIKKLNEAAKRLTDGEFDFDIEADTYDEIGELTNTFIETRKILKQQINLLDTEAHIDGLTGVGNKSAFMDRERELNCQIAEGTADFAVVAFDVNKLKVANDVFGHMAGDKLLLTVASYLATVFEPANVYRLGGDEFVAIIPNTENVDAKITTCIEGMNELSIEGYPDFQVTCAYGVSSFKKLSDHQLSDVLRRADKEMYKNKTETKKLELPWQHGTKGIKQLQIDKYCELLKILNESTDDYLFLMNVETGKLHFFNGGDTSFALIDNAETVNDIEKLMSYVYSKDHALVRAAIASVINRDTETISINFRMHNNNNNNMRWVDCRGNIIKDENDSHFLFIGRISQNAVSYLHNPVTTLFNKTKFKTDITGDISNKFSYLMLIDIDKLSEINLKHDSVYGDNLLKELAENLESRFNMEQLYHIEKDRFVVLLNVDSNEEVVKIFEEIKAEIAEKCSISASVVANDPAMYVNADNIYNYAVQILSNAKKIGEGQIVFFSKEGLLEKISELELLEDLEKSVKNNCEGFHLVFQPQIKAEDYSIASAEALLRFNSESKGQVFPDQFIPVLERTGLINEVGVWVVEKALERCKKWREYNPDFKISVNISPKQLENKENVSRIISLLSNSKLPGDALILEITESTRLDESENTFAAISAFQKAGIQIAIDDFGTGYSNLGNLKDIQANILKVDRVFIKDIKENGYNYNLVYNILDFAKSNSLKVCLEGVETKDELIVLSGLRPDIFQGYLFDKPCAPDFLEAKYFIKDSEEYISRIKAIEQLNKEKSHAPIFKMETKSILSGLDIGLWIIRVNKTNGEGELYTDGVMKKLLGVDSNVTPSECYLHWRKHIPENQVQKVDEMVSEMQKTPETVVRVEYLWQHPENGEVLVRCYGRCSEESNDSIVFEGFHRVINE